MLLKKVRYFKLLRAYTAVLLNMADSCASDFCFFFTHSWVPQQIMSNNVMIIPEKSASENPKENPGTSEPEISFTRNFKAIISKDICGNSSNGISVSGNSPDDETKLPYILPHEYPAFRNSGKRRKPLPAPLLSRFIVDEGFEKCDDDFGEPDDAEFAILDTTSHFSTGRIADFRHAALREQQACERSKGTTRRENTLPKNSRGGKKDSSGKKKH